MTATATLTDRATDRYMRFHDVYVKHDDDTLDVIRGGARQPYSYASGQWTDVEGDQKAWKKGRFWGLLKREARSPVGRFAALRG